MHAPSTGVMRVATRMLVAAVAALAAFLAFQASSAHGAPQTQTWIGNQPATPDIRRGDLQYFRPNGVRATTGSAGTVNLLLDGQPVVVYCSEVNNPINGGTVTSDVRPIDAPGPEDRAVRWILLNQTPTGPVTPEKRAQAATAQVAIWVLRNQIRAVDPTDDPATNAAVAALIARARAESAAVSVLSLASAPGIAGDRIAHVEITARPGAVVSLAVTSGPGTLSTGSVTVGADGKGRVDVAGAGGGTTVAAVTAGDGTLREIKPADGSQNTAVAAGSQLSASITVRESEAATQVVTPLGSPVATQVRGALRLTKTAPARARVLSRVAYTITIRNSSRVRVRNVRLVDRIPGGMSYGRSTDGGVLQDDGRIRWSIGTLRPGESRTVKVWLVAGAAVRGSRTNLATVTASNARTVKAQVRTLFQAVRRPVRIAVTG